MSFTKRGGRRFSGSDAELRVIRYTFAEGGLAHHATRITTLAVRRIQLREHFPLRSAKTDLARIKRRTRRARAASRRGAPARSLPRRPSSSRARCCAARAQRPARLLSATGAARLQQRLTFSGCIVRRRLGGSVVLLGTRGRRLGVGIGHGCADDLKKGRRSTISALIFPIMLRVPVPDCKRTNLVRRAPRIPCQRRKPVSASM